MDPMSPSVNNNITNNSNSDSQSSQQNKIISNSTTNGLTRNEGPTSSKNSEYGKQRKTPLRQKSSNPSLVDQSLDEWLDNCMRDTNYMSSSTEFLEKNLPPPPMSSTAQSNPYLNLSTNFPYPMNRMTTTGTSESNPYFSSYQHYPADQFRIGTSAGYGGNTPYNNQLLHNNPSGFTSLPPAVNLMTSTELKCDSQDPLDTLDNRRYSYRFSDPCLAAGNSDNDSKGSGGQNQQANQPPRSNSSNLLSTLLQQINILHDTNAKICRNLQDTKVDIEALKHAPNWGMRHRRDSISGLSTHSQPMGGYAFSTNSPAPTFHSAMYAPGMMTDVVREVKDAARIREEALLSRVKAMVEERSWTINDTNLKMIRDMEEMKIQINHLKKDRNETNTRLTRMEEEIKSLRLLLSHVLNVSRLPQQPPAPPQPPLNTYETECDFVRPATTNRHVKTTRQNRHSLNLNYGTISNDMLPLGCAIENEIIRPINQDLNDLRKMDKLKYSQTNGKHSVYATAYATENHNGLSRSYDSEHLYTTPESEQNDDHIVQMEKETLELRRELQEAIAGQKHAEKKAQVLEDLVKNLQHQPTGNSKTIDSTNHSTISSRNSSISETNSILSQHGKMQLASQIQTISPKLMASNISLSGPVTDL